MIFINSRFLTQLTTGVQRYAIEICKNLPRTINGKKVVLLAPKSKLLHVKELADFEIHQFGYFTGNLWEQLDLPNFLRKNKNSLLINFGGIGPVFYKNKITYIHDLAFKHHPNYYSFAFQKAYNILLPRSAKNAKRIVTVSEFVKDDIFKTFSFSNVDVVYPSISNSFIDHNQEKEKIILALSSLSPRKNIDRVISAFQQIQTEYKLVFIGSVKNTFSKFEIDRYKKEHNIEFRGYLKDDEIIEWYNKASVFIYASTFEGFGIPPLEAQACGCACLVANVTSLPEVYEDSVLYCNPFSVDDIKIQLKKLIQNPELRASYIQKGKGNTARFSWEKSALKLTSIIKKLDR